MKERIREIVRRMLKEMSATGTGAFSTPGEGEETATPVAGVAPNYYVKKLGYKLVNKNKLHKQAKGIESKQLWKGKKS
jgi:hypothetical protein